MKNLLAFLFFIVAIISCNVPKENELNDLPISKFEALTEIGEENILHKEQEKTEVKSKSKLLLIAGGSEPGWHADFFEDHLYFLMDSGTDSLIFKHDFSKINASKNFHFSSTEAINNTQLHLIISISDTTCFDEASGEKREKCISIKYKNKIYTGCTMKVLN